jgi:hypothetical protein
VTGVFELASSPRREARALMIQSQQLALTRAADLEAADRPQIELIIELLADARGDASIDLERTAQLFHRTVIAVVHARMVGSPAALALDVDTVFGYAARGAGLTLPPSA